MQKDSVLYTVFVSHQAGEQLKSHILEKGHHLICLPSTSATYDAVSSHADLYLCPAADGLVVAKEQWETIYDQVSGNPAWVCQNKVSAFIPAEKSLGYSYPENIGLNGVQLGNFFIHNLRYTDPALLRLIDNAGLVKIHVKQGYTKCNLMVVDEKSVITSDAGIAHALRPHHIDVLSIRPGFVKLTGFPHGFLGGAGGRLSGEILFNGNLADHPDFEEILHFIKARGLSPRWFPEYVLEDIGSIIAVGSQTLAT